jgi:hypothetical protein
VSVASSELAANMLVDEDNVQEDGRAVGSHDHNARAGEACRLCLTNRHSKEAVAVLAVGERKTKLGALEGSTALESP